MSATRRKARWPVALLVVLLAAVAAGPPALAESYDGLTIEEIVVTGISRTPEQVVLRQLPFAVGDAWKSDYTELTLTRLQAMDLFDPQNLRVTVEPLGPGSVRVVVRVSDPHVLYNDPIEFVVVHGQELLSNSFNQTIRNPFGNGMNISLGGRWGSSMSLSAGVDFSLSRGWIAQADYTFADVSPAFYPQGLLTPHYTSKGSSVQASLTRYASNAWTYGLTVGYRQAEVSLNGGAEGPQGFVQLVPKLGWSGPFDASITLRAAVDVTGGGGSHQSVVGKLAKEWEPGRHYIGLTALGGYMTPQAPLNLQFTMGGFGTLPLRGHGSGFVGNAFVNGTAEYRLCVDGRIVWLAGFADFGRMWYYGEPGGAMSAYGWQLDAGLGLAVETPLGFPVRIDVAHGIADDAGWKWSIYLDYDF